jgi:antitoxin component YwqK of YwqJK toxin-antitoxin module
LKKDYLVLPCTCFKKHTSLRTKLLSKIIFLFLGITLLSFSDPYTIKRISDVNFRYEFYTTKKTLKPKQDKIYYWFKGGVIHNAQSGIAGELLHDEFLKFYHSNQLAEQGKFNDGLKKGLWKTWHPNGILETTQNWSSGFKSGDYKRFDEKGNLLEKGRYGDNKKQGKWINYLSNDTTEYRRGLIYLKKTKESLSINEEIKTDIKDSKVSSDETQKKGFFKRLFQKKQPKKNGQGT